ncbi:MAG: NAD(P)-binding domain-containing protein [Kiritimatiellaeota bacterium]|nr:NAD(P)-binding domain-containing protein [Kiritimatiellota bacterium]
MKKILIPTSLDAVAGDTLRRNGKYTVVQDSKTPLPELAAANRDAYALIVRSEKIGAEIMEALPALKLIVRAGAGYDNIDAKAARRRGIDVMNTPGANANAVAEEVVALILADARHIIAADVSTRAGKWEKNKFMGRELAKKTVGIIGLGNIGRLVAKRIEGFECAVLGYDPLVPTDTTARFGIKSADLQTIFKEADFITLHIPENDETRGIVNAKLLSLMKPGAALVNCARSGIVNEADLRAAKADRGIRYLNDVYPKDAEGEKPIADVADIMMPHLGASTYEANETAALRAAQQIIDFDEKGVTSFIVNRDIPAGLDPSYCELASTLAKLARGIVGKNLPPTRIETSCYGRLAPFDKWLVLSVLGGLWDDIDRSTDYSHAMQWLADNGVHFVNREPDPTKDYENSMTVEISAVNEKKEVVTASVRGTVGENVKMIARINEFDRLYWVPDKRSLFFQYKDRTGVIGLIGQRLAKAGVNIEDMRNPHNAATGNSLAILNVSPTVSDDLLNEIATAIDASVAKSVSLP